MSEAPMLLFPLLGFIHVFFFGHVYGRALSIMITNSLLIITWVYSVTGWIHLVTTGICTHTVLFKWVISTDMIMDWGMKFNETALIMGIVVTTISMCVHIYSIGYMSSDPRSHVFSSYLSLFTFFMLILVYADNLVFLYVGWEGVGLASFLLISYWNTRYAAIKAAVKAMVTNRVSDVFLFIGILLLAQVYGTVNLDMISLTQAHMLTSEATNYYHIVILAIATFNIFIGVVGKSAQLFMHVWLADAMEGPTPVSALLHAATMVTAGVVLLIKTSWLFSFFPWLTALVAIWGVSTSCMASCASVYQMDIKKVIAYSTCSQLGYMVMACGLSYYNLALFHLFNHAFFKALLFLGAGSIIHGVGDEQDMRRMGGLSNFLPFTLLCMSVGSLAIMGIPFLAGFYSKDLILELTAVSYVVDSIFLYVLGVVAAFCTAVYSIRLLLAVFFMTPKGYHTTSPHEADHYMTTSLAILLLASCVMGYLFHDYFVGLGSPVLSDTICYLPWNYTHTNVFLVTPLVKNLPLLLSIFGWIIGFYIVRVWQNSTNTPALRYLVFKINVLFTRTFYHALFFNILYNNIFINVYKYSYYIHTKSMDKGVWEYFGPVGIYRTTRMMSKNVRNLSYSLSVTLAYMFFGIVILSLYIIVNGYSNEYYLYNLGVAICVAIIVYYEFVNFKNSQEYRSTSLNNNQITVK